MLCLVLCYLKNDDNFYTNSEMTDIHFMHGRAKNNASKAARLYYAAYPNRRQPSRRMFSKIHQCETGVQFKPNLIAVDRDLLELLQSSKIFYVQLKKILEHRRNPAKKSKPSHCVKHFV